MNAIDLDQFVGIPHTLEHDCCDLAIEVSERLFNRKMDLPRNRPRPRDDNFRHYARDVKVASEQLAVRITPEEAQDGDLIFMFDGGSRYPTHVGTYFKLSHEGWVLHSTQALGHSSLHRLRDLPRLSLRIEGYYRWK